MGSEQPRPRGRKRTYRCSLSLPFSSQKISCSARGVSFNCFLAVCRGKVPALCADAKGFPISRIGIAGSAAVKRDKKGSYILGLCVLWDQLRFYLQLLLDYRRII